MYEVGYLVVVEMFIEGLLWLGLLKGSLEENIVEGYY